MHKVIARQKKDLFEVGLVVTRMAFAYPEFHGSKGEDVEDFLERMEVACISNHIQEPA